MVIFPMSLTRVDAEVIRRALLLWESHIAINQPEVVTTGEIDAAQVLTDHVQDLFRRMAQAEAWADGKTPREPSESDNDNPF